MTIRLPPECLFGGRVSSAIPGPLPKAHRLTLVDSNAHPAPLDCRPEILCRVPGWKLFKQSQYHKAEWIRERRE